MAGRPTSRSLRLAMAGHRKTQSQIVDDRKEMARAKAVRLEKLVEDLEGAARDAAPPPPVLDPPELLPSFLRVEDGVVEERESAGAGRGLYAAVDLPRGSTVLVDTPIARVMDVDEPEMDDGASEDGAEDEDEDNSDPLELDPSTGQLVITIANSLASNEDKGGSGGGMLDALEELHPRAGDEWPLAASQPEQWHCGDGFEQLSSNLHAALARLASQGEDRAPKKQAKKRRVAGKVKRHGLAALALRLPEIVRCNALGFYTSPEMLCHPRSYAVLSGLGLYPRASLFNHSCTPNVSRYNLGDVAVFRTNRMVRAGEELRISYIEHELLCESPAVRQLALGDHHRFHVQGYVPDEAAHGPVVTADVQQELMASLPKDRLEEVAAILEDQDTAPLLLQVDRKELAVLRAVTHMQLGDLKKVQSGT